MSKQKKRFFIILGIICVIVGLIGIFIPILPTTPFLLAAEFFFARSSEKFQNWLFANKLFGPYLKKHKNGQGLPLKDKVITILLLWLTIGASIIFFIEIIWIEIFLILIALGVTTHLNRIKRYRPVFDQVLINDEPMTKAQLSDKA